MNREPRILFLDIETAPIIMAAWQVWEANAVWVERDTFILSFAAKWMGGKVKTYALPDYPRYKKDKYDDKFLVSDLRDMLDEADIVIAHNGKRFDLPKIRARMLVNKIAPPSASKIIDTLQVARTCKFDSNKLDNLGRYLGEGRKIPNTGAALWRGCYNGDPKSWRIMRRYNAQDVLLLERVYERLKPWMPNHPNLNLYTGQSNCPTCQSSRVKRKGMQYLKSTVRQRMLCLDCESSWCGEIIRSGQCESPSHPARATADRRAATSRTRTTATSRPTRSTGRGKRKANEVGRVRKASRG